VARDAGVADSVFFVGWRGHDELPTGLACADVMVAPSVNEPFGQVFLEAMACGLPVVTTATGGPLSFVNTEADRLNGWLVPPDDEAALADALVEVVTDADERRARGRNAYEHVRAHYAWRALAHRFAACYDSVLASA
jgi:glycosyltransferase involved in cell wall biosynthesis